jgi:hypothetical protein
MSLELTTENMRSSRACDALMTASKFTLWTVAGAETLESHGRSQQFICHLLRIELLDRNKHNVVGTQQTQTVADLQFNGREAVSQQAQINILIISIRLLDQFAAARVSNSQLVYAEEDFS